jgi:hypothetical protein
LVAAEKFPALLQATVEQLGHSPQQVSDLGETGLFWKRMPRGRFVSVEEKVALGFKACKDCCTLLLGANASGDNEIKLLMVYQSGNSSALKGYSKDGLSAVWSSNKEV